MPHVHPKIEPYASGMLAAGDEQLVHWETCGDPAGKPALVLHGGPGGGCTPRHRRLFDPQRYQIVLFDQRGCGRSRPHAGDPATDLAVNTTRHLIDDIEMLRTSLEIDRWLVYGNSWGPTLAQRSPACRTGWTGRTGRTRWWRGNVGDLVGSGPAELGVC